MYFLTCNKTKTIMGWSGKSGCSHTKRIFRYLAYNQDIDNHDKIHQNTYNKLPGDISNYTIILIMRNPYKRLVSGFLEKYNPAPGSSGTCHSMWTLDKPLSFANFVDEVVKSNWEVIHEHHFIKQLSEEYHPRIEKHNKLFVYDLENIDYAHLERIFNKKISPAMMSYRGGHENTREVVLHKPIHDLPIEDYNDFKIPLTCFYSEEIKNKVDNYFKDDFAFCSKFGIDYKLE